MFLKKLFLLIAFVSSLVSANLVIGQVVVLDSTIHRFELKQHSSFVKTNQDTLELTNLKNHDWEKDSNGANLGMVLDYYWFKYEFFNPYESETSFKLYFPYHHLKAIDIYQTHNQDSTLLAEHGTTRYFPAKEVNTPGYVKTIVFEPGYSNLFIHINHVNMPLRANCYLLSNSELNEVVKKSERSYTVWKIAVLVALCISLLFFFVTKIYLFLAYFFLNLGVFIFIGIEIGGFFTFFTIDSHLWLFDLKHLGVIIVLVTFPYFLNMLTPISKINPRVWRLMYFLIGLAFVFWLFGLNNNIKDSKFFFINVWYLIILTGFVFFTQLYFLLISFLNKEKNSRILLLIYSSYILAVTYEVIMPNIGLKSDNIFVYDMLLKTSIIEIILFSVLIGREINSIYGERNRLLVEQNLVKEKILIAIVTNQESERNSIGMELHDLIGANLSVIKQNVDKNNQSIIKVINETIESVRNLSHGLMTPKVEGNHLKDEIIDLCLISSNDKLTVNYYFHNWEPLKSKTNSTHLYRIFQELLQNSIKHSNSTNIYVQINRDSNQISMLYEDNGEGFDVEKESNDGKGLISIAHRVEILKGKIRYDSSIKGTSVELLFEDE